MSKFKATKIINYPIEEVFKGFIKITKREFPKFNDKNPLGIKHSKVIKDNGISKIKLVMEITKFEKNSIYEITSTVHNDVYISRYTFEKISEEETKVTLEEEQNVKNLVSKIALLFQSIIATSKAKEKIGRMSDGVSEEIELLRARVSKNAKKN